MDILSAESTQRDSAAILAKVQKLLAKTVENGCTEDEASSAASKVQELLQAHNLSLAAFDKAEPKPVYEARERTDTGKVANFHYQRKLMETLAANNFCLCFVVGDKSKRHQLLGRAVNVLVTVKTYEYLINAMAGLQPFKGKDANRWLDGCTDRLIERLRERRYQQEMESWKAREEGNGTDLILADVYGSEAELNNDAEFDLAPGTTAARNRKWAMQNEAWRAQERAYQQKESELVAAGMDKDAAYYVARGREVPAPPPPKSAKEQRDDERREQRYKRHHDRQYAQWDREAEAERLRKENPAYQAGRKTAENIGLDQQIH